MKGFIQVHVIWSGPVSHITTNFEGYEASKISSNNSIKGRTIAIDSIEQYHPLIQSFSYKYQVSFGSPSPLPVDKDEYAVIHIKNKNVCVIVQETTKEIEEKIKEANN